MVRSWRTRSPAPNDCVGPAALWWQWARERYGDAQLPSAAWHGTWTTQAVALELGDTQHLLVLARAADGSWTAREWRWNPSERPATRRWQAGRWSLLIEAARQWRQGVPGGASEAPYQPLMAAWMRSVGKAPAEVAAGQWRWISAGRCMVLDALDSSRGSFQMPYLVEDSRLEQRSAMQLQLARRHPGVAWLRPFSLVDATPAGKAGLARFKAVWRESDMVRGQLWIPTKGNGPVFRLRVSTPLTQPAGAGAAPAAQAVERELEQLVKFVGNIDG